MRINSVMLALAAGVDFALAEPQVGCPNAGINRRIISGTPEGVIPVASVNPTQWFLSVASSSDADDKTATLEKRDDHATGVGLEADSTVFWHHAHTLAGIGPSYLASIPNHHASKGAAASASYETFSSVAAHHWNAAPSVTVTPTVDRQPSDVFSDLLTGCLTCTSGPVPTYGGRGPIGDTKSLNKSWTSKYGTSICGHVVPKDFLSVLGSSSFCEWLNSVYPTTVHQSKFHNTKRAIDAQTTSPAPSLPPAASVFPTNTPDVASIQSAAASRKSAGHVWTTPNSVHTTVTNPLAAEMAKWSSFWAEIFSHPVKSTLLRSTVKVTAVASSTPQMHTMASVNVTTSSIDRNCPGC